MARDDGHCLSHAVHAGLMLLLLHGREGWFDSVIRATEVFLCCLDEQCLSESVHAGLMLILLYGREGWFAPVIRATGFNVVYAFPGQLPMLLFSCDGLAHVASIHCILSVSQRVR